MEKVEGLYDLIKTKTREYDFEGRRQHAYNKIEWHVPKHLRGRFLDIGCGPGNAVIAALQHGFEMAIGIDRSLSEFPNFKFSLPVLCVAHGLNPQKALLIEADIFNVGFNPGAFDCVLLLDSAEHVPNPAAFVKYAADQLAPGGVLMVDTCPLYYSKSGGHMFEYFDFNKFPWVHLRKDFDELVKQAKVDAWTMQRFGELNKITHDDLRQAFADHGLKVIVEHRSQPNDEDRALLERDAHLLNLDGIDEKVLFEDWVLLVGQK